MIKHLRITILLLFISASAFSQSQKEFLEYGDNAFKNEDYASAAYFYLQILDKGASADKDIVYPYDAKPYYKREKVSKDSTKAVAKNDSASASKVAANEKNSEQRQQYVIHQVAESYRLNHDYENAEIWYERSAQNTSTLYPDEKYWYSVVLMNNQKYPKAMQVCDNYMRTTPDSTGYIYKRAQKNIISCLLALDSTNVNKAITLQELDSNFNKGTSSFAISYYGDANTLSFTSARPGGTVTDPKTQNSNFLADIYTVKKTETGYSVAQNIGGPFNSAIHEGASVLSLDRTFFFFTRWSPINKNECGIYLARNVSDKWLEPMKLGDAVNVEGFKSMHPALSADGSTLYYSSNREGGEGKMDLWSCAIDDNGNASKPVNMGKQVNTPEDETTPFFHHYTQTLFFSSNGHVGIGGMDVFKTQFNDDDNIWTTPKNLGKPVNSSRDDLYYIIERSQMRGYVTSDRTKCVDCNTGGNCYRNYVFEKEPNKYSVSGYVYDKDTKQIISTALVTFKDVKGDKETFFLITDENGFYSTPLTEGMELFLKAQKNKYFADAASLSTMGLTESKDFKQDFYLSLIPSGDIVIPGIEYDYDKATLRPESKKICSDLADFLTLNNNLSVEISSHTDVRGSDKYNQRLSQERAQSVVDFLIEKGIAKERLQAAGYGESKNLVTEAEINKLATSEEKEAAHQKNRRTAFRPFKEDLIRTTK